MYRYCMYYSCFFFFKQKTAYEMRISDWSSDVCSSDLANYHITDPGSLDADLGKDEPRSGTLAYRAPELVGDAVPTVKSDIYALGLILYQLVVGDFSASLAPGWEGRVTDPLLRGAIGRAAAGKIGRAHV